MSFGINRAIAQKTRLAGLEIMGANEEVSGVLESVDSV
jgi:hypothetical protein